MPAKKKVVKKKVVKKAAVKKTAVKKKAAAKKKVARKSAVTSKPKTPAKPFKIPKMPKSIGGMVDAIYKQGLIVREKQTALNDAKQLQEDMIDHAMMVFKKDDLEGSKGKLGQASISCSVVPQAEDPAAWEKIFKYILKKKDFAILQKRLGVTHIRDLWEDGVQIPGVIPFPRVTLSITKVKAKK